MTLPAALALSLALTLGLEAALFLLTGKRKKRDLLLVALVNLMTNPAAVLLYWLAAQYTAWHPAAVMAPLELCVLWTEGYHYRRYGQGFKRPYLFSAAANAFSFGIGLLLGRWI